MQRYTTQVLIIVGFAYRLCPVLALGSKKLSAVINCIPKGDIYFKVLEIHPYTCLIQLSFPNLEFSSFLPRNCRPDLGYPSVAMAIIVSLLFQ